MFCTKCGRELANEETYCPYCGTVFSYPDGTPRASSCLPQLRRMSGGLSHAVRGR